MGIHNMKARMGVKESKQLNPDKRITKVSARAMERKFRPAIKRHVPKKMTVSYLTPEEGIVCKKEMTPNQFKRLQKEQKQKKQTSFFPRSLLVKPELIVIEKDYDSGAKYTRQLDPTTNKTIDFTYETGNGHMFYQRIQPELRTNVYHNRRTGKKVTTDKRLKRKQIDWLEPEKRSHGINEAQLKKTVSKVFLRKEADEPKSKGSDINTLVYSTVPSLVVLAADEIANQRAKENDPAMAKSYASSQLSVDESSPDSSSNDSISDVEAREPAIQPKNDESGSDVEAREPAIQPKSDEPGSGQMLADESSSDSSSTSNSTSDAEAREAAIQPKSDECGSGQMPADESSSDSSSTSNLTSDAEAREPSIQPKSDESGSGQMLADESSSDSSSYEAFFYVN